MSSASKGKVVLVVVVLELVLVVLVEVVVVELLVLLVEMLVVVVELVEVEEEVVVEVEVLELVEVVDVLVLVLVEVDELVEVVLVDVDEEVVVLLDVEEVELLVVVVEEEVVVEVEVSAAGEKEASDIAQSSGAGVQLIVTEPAGDFGPSWLMAILMSKLIPVTLTRLVCPAPAVYGPESLSSPTISMTQQLSAIVVMFREGLLPLPMPPLLASG